MDYPVSVQREPAGNVRVSFPDFPEAQAVGKDEAEGLSRAQDALASAIGALIRSRRPVPAPSSAAAHRVAVPALIEAKIRLYDAMRAANVGKSDLARRLRWHLPQVDRLFDVNHASRLEQLEAAFAALGKRLVLDVRDEETRPEPARGAGRATTAFEVQWD